MPEIIPSTFEEDLPHSAFDNVYEYPVATATGKAVEVYERLVVRLCVHYPAFHKSHHLSQREQPEDGPDLVIGG